MIKKILEWFGVVFFAVLALAAFSMGGIIGGIIFLLLAFICSPYRYLLINLLPEKLKKTAVVVTASVVLFFAGFLGIPTDSSTDSTSEVVEDVTEVATDIDKSNLSSEINDGESEDTSSNSTIEEEDTEKEKEEDVTQKAKETETKLADEKSAAQKTTEEASAQKASDDAAAQKAAEEAAAQKEAEAAAAQKAAEEAAAQKAAEEAAAQQAAAQANSSTVANGTESADALAVLNMGPTTGSPCWVPRNGGKKYHSSSSCSGMDDPIYTTVDTATACGFDACKKCH